MRGAESGEYGPLHQRYCDLGQGSIVVGLDWTANELQNGLGNTEWDLEDPEETISWGFGRVVWQNLWPQ